MPLTSSSALPPLTRNEALAPGASTWARTSREPPPPPEPASARTAQHDRGRSQGTDGAHRPTARRAVFRTPRSSRAPHARLDRARTDLAAAAGFAACRDLAIAGSGSGSGSGSDRDHDPLLEVRRGGQLRGRERERIGRHLQPGHLLAAGGTALEVDREALVLLLGERPEHVCGRVLAEGVVPVRSRERAHCSTSAGCASVDRIFARPRRMRPLTVPTGVSSSDAISTWVSPPK